MLIDMTRLLFLNLQTGISVKKQKISDSKPVGNIKKNPLFAIKIALIPPCEEQSNLFHFLLVLLAA